MRGGLGEPEEGVQDEEAARGEGVGSVGFWDTSPLGSTSSTSPPLPHVTEGGCGSSGIGGREVAGMMVEPERFGVFGNGQNSEEWFVSEKLLHDSPCLPGQFKTAAGGPWRVG